MKQNARHITIEEAEKLCQLYMDCQLSVLEESELEYVLMKTELNSPLINETRVLMGISRSFNLQAKKKRLFVIWGWRAVACVAILIGCAVLMRNHNTNKTDTVAYVEDTEISVDNTKCIDEVEVVKMEQSDNMAKAEESVKIKTTQAESQPKPSTLSTKHSKRKTEMVRQKPSDMIAPQQEPPIIAETTTLATEPTMLSTNFAPEQVVYVINGERQEPTPDMPSINDLRMRGERLTTEVKQKIQESHLF